MSKPPDTARARYRLLAGIGGGVLVVVVCWLGLRATRGDEAAAPADRAGASVSRSTNPGSSLARRGPARRGDLPALAAQGAPADDETSIVMPVPARLGGDTPVSSSTAELAERMHLVPTELAQLADEPGGELPDAFVRAIEDAHARGAALGERLGLTPPEIDLVAGRFTNQLVRVEREAGRSPHVKFEDVVEVVTRDTLEDLRRNLGDDVAQAAEADVRGLEPLRPH